MSEALAFGALAALATATVAYRLKKKNVPPKAKRIPAHVLIGAVPGQNRGEEPMTPPIAIVDDLLWLRDDTRKEKDVIQHLEAENAYTAFKTASLQPAIDSFYTELLGRVKESDAGMPYKDGPWSYYTRTEKGKSYTIHARVPSSSSAGTGTVGVPLSVVQSAAGRSLPGEQVYLDENILGKGSDMLDVANVEPSPGDGAVIAFTVDFSGYETYACRFKLANDPTPCLGHTGAATPFVSAQAGLGEEMLVDIDGDIVWGADASCVYYKTFDSAHRPNKVWRHVLGTPQAADECLFTEEDEKYWVNISKSKSGHYIFIDSSSKMTSEVYAIRLCPHPEGTDSALVSAETVGKARQITPRQQGTLYEVEHYLPSTGVHTAVGPALPPAGFFVVTTNADGAKNFKICVAPLSTPGREHWVTLLEQKDINVTGVGVWAGFMAVYGREGGYKNMWLMSSVHVCAFYAAAFASAQGARKADAALCAVPLTRIQPMHHVYVISGSGGNEEYEASRLRFKYGSPVTPECTLEIDVSAAGVVGAATVIQGREWAGTVKPASEGSISLLKQKEVPNCDPSAYSTARVWATAPDGVRVPISIVYRPDRHGLPRSKGQEEGGQASPAAFKWTSIVSNADGAAESGPCPLPAPAPTLLYGYGSYGHAIDMWFNGSVLSLLDRGVVYAVAHVRGGGEMGRAWYEDMGKLLTKKNTFSDFIACGELLLSHGWTAKGRLGAMGASAGGLLMGVCVNTRPDLFDAVVSQVGFVDVIQSVADPTIPLAVTEWEEWGNPNSRLAYEYMRSYSPLDTVTPAPFPRILLTAGLHDSRVAYWEPAKYAQRLRNANTGGHPILLKTDMGAGHFSYSDRYAYLREKSFDYAWLCDALGVRV